MANTIIINETKNWEQNIRDHVTTNFKNVDTALLELYVNILKNLSTMSEPRVTCTVEVFNYTILYIKLNMVNEPVCKGLSTGHQYRYDFDFERSVIETDDGEGWYDSWFELSRDYAWEHIRKNVEYSKKCLRDNSVA